MRQIGEVSNGNVIVEMSYAEWLSILCASEPLFDLSTVCKNYRRKNNVSQTALAKQAGITRSYLCRIERNQANVSLKIYGRLIAVIHENTEVALEE